MNLEPQLKFAAPVWNRKKGKITMGNKAYEEIKYNEKLIAMILRSNYTLDNIVFFSPPDFSQQLGYLPHKKGSTIRSHIHKQIDRKITLTQEVLFMRKGRILVNLYTENKKYITSRELSAGDVILLCSGGHGFKILEDTEMIEVKQGPFSGKENDKEVFEGIE